MDRIERDVVVNASRQRVWNALTSAEHLGTWFGDAGATVSTWAEHGTGSAIIEKVEPESFLSWRWSGPLGPDPVPGSAGGWGHELDELREYFEK